MLRSFFMEVPKDLEESAMVDGANRLTSFLHVIVPVAWPGIISTALFTLLLAYNEFLLVRVLTQTNWTLPVRHLSLHWRGGSSAIDAGGGGIGLGDGSDHRGDTVFPEALDQRIGGRRGEGLESGTEFTPVWATRAPPKENRSGSCTTLEGAGEPK